MKKAYMTPAMEVIKVDVANMMAASAMLFDTAVDTSTSGVQLGREISNGAKDLDLLWD